LIDVASVKSNVVPRRREPIVRMEGRQADVAKRSAGRWSIPLRGQRPIGETILRVVRRGPRVVGLEAGCPASGRFLKKN